MADMWATQMALKMEGKKVVAKAVSMVDLTVHLMAELKVVKLVVL